jgi:hypothetical protein
MRLENSARFDLTAIFGDLEKFKESQIALARMLEPFLRSQEAAARYLARELEPLMRIAQSEEYQSMMRNLANKLRHLNYTAGDWIKDCRLGAETKARSVEPHQKPKRILGFLGGVRHI